MAGEWIAMRHDLWECPQVVRILSAMCPQSVRDMSARCRVVGALYRTWCIFDRFTEDGILSGYTPDILDEEIGLAGWTANLQHVGWLVIDEQSLVVPEFTEYFGESARRRMKDRKRKAEARKPCPQNVRTEVDKKRTTEQNRTEQKKSKKTPLPPLPIPGPLSTPEFVAAWNSWQQHRREIGHPLKPTQAAKQIEQFMEWGISRSVVAIKYTITKGWQGLREPDADNNRQSASQSPRRTLDDVLNQLPDDDHGNTQ